MAVPTAHVIFCLDCSSSMSWARKATQDAFNMFVQTLQKTKGAEVKLTLIEYRDKAKTIYKAKPIQDVAVMDDYRPDSGEDTLYDVVHYAVDIAERHKGSVKTVICILCDGGDTSSRRTADDAKALIEKKRAAGIEFCFLAANAYDIASNPGLAAHYAMHGPAAIAARIGIPPESILNYGQKDQKKSLEAFGASAWNVGAFSSGRAAHVAYSDEQKKAAV